MDEELRRQVEALKDQLHAEGVTDYQRYEALSALSTAAIKAGTDASAGMPSEVSK